LIEQKQKWPESVIVYTDGASRGNPGPAAIGIHVTDMDSQTIAEHGEVLGVQTNNFAEYTAVIRALELSLAQGVKNVILRSDSELMVKQMTGVYKVKSDAILPLYDRVRELLSRFSSVTFEHVRRENNRVADRLANEALDRA